MPMPLNQLLPAAEGGVLIRELTLDSRKVRPGDLFLAVPGTQQDGRVHIADAIARGAAAVAFEAEGAAPMHADSAVLVPVKGLAGQLSAIAGRFYGEPSRALHLVGVTGTNGKTSVSQLLAQALDLLGQPCGIVGTLGTGFYGALEQGKHTTPDPVGVQATLASLKQAGARAVAMEVSSHGLDQGRVAALEFDIAVFTNLSRDHLDYHGSMEAYGAAKAKLFAWPNLRCRVINLDDAFGRELAGQAHGSRLIGYSLNDAGAFLYCSEAHFDDHGVRARLVTPRGEGVLRSNLLGRFNLSNLLAVVGALLGLDYALDEILKVLPQLQGPAGRMQRLGGGDKPLVVVDYAHTPDALEKVLEAMRPHVEGRLVCLFGCGGDRDRGKRPLMAAVAERLADAVWVTDDNPRTEEPAQIVADIRAGFAAPEQVQFIHGRGDAIARLIAQAEVADVLVLAGKGHEDYQEIMGVRQPFSDLIEANKALTAWEVTHA
ncbi:UDP-N-acetylmuramoyl-L-alanyl-D-glutamate--2,6-diaminopimelate ligase [Ectopseudomonas mendocina]|uniref:UDP-N-acetylmuramoyl-L-alanyl-D-glutamate--2,6-diaminopimelate ligase n=1 Tax=Ectopseudomonas oleovorans TaxID=301 RepID=A0A3R8XXF1_ECTOL|nr:MULTISPECIES: UDP-N-acetylmuramoyl-L-alanyl-D-glutamate--2,6-diaminopimelate ligase [Pseudomonas aeruginosa group]RRW38038.1 UDP-N-acetylmuramoyl-L-alanyl-D-glutamate--2,6-diaminopimelate ligase [Pseudomonas oleovorans]TRO19680.1 UDP-N-acetylmuramoyl-L-alanyl-D-glutamate--2,6-diaminopimelate ligase [Pseudomonas mendocina]TRO23937.1 UDP-N-acetylmuramoyl-L-alanyl-D-glutamate--2,6-diaminopimelate ligase [Pseudomonas mendocina]